MEKINKRDYATLPVLPAESLLVSIRNPGKFLLSLLFLLLLFLGQGPLKVLDHSIFLLLWSVTLTLLLTGEESRTMKKQSRDILCLFHLKEQKISTFTTNGAVEEGGSLYRIRGVGNWYEANMTGGYLVLLFHFLTFQMADLGKDVILILQDKPPLSVIFVPVQLNNQRLLIEVQLTLFWDRAADRHISSSSPIFRANIFRHICAFCGTYRHWHGPHTGNIWARTASSCLAWISQPMSRWHPVSLLCWTLWCTLWQSCRQPGLGSRTASHHGTPSPIENRDKSRTKECFLYATRVLL